MFKRFVCFSTKRASWRRNYPNFAEENIRGKTSIEKFILKFARFCKLIRHAQLNSFNCLWKAFTITGPLISPVKTYISCFCGNFPPNAITPTDMQPANVPPRPPPACWHVSCQIHRVRNFSCISLRRPLLFRLTSLQHFYFGKYLIVILETWSTQIPLVSWCRQLNIS